MHQCVFFFYEYSDSEENPFSCTSFAKKLVNDKTFMSLYRIWASCHLPTSNWTREVVCVNGKWSEQYASPSTLFSVLCFVFRAFQFHVRKKERDISTLEKGIMYITFHMWLLLLLWLITQLVSINFNPDIFTFSPDCLLWHHQIYDTTKN